LDKDKALDQTCMFNDVRNIRESESTNTFTDYHVYIKSLKMSWLKIIW